MKKLKVGIAGLGYSAGGTSRGTQIYKEFIKFEEVQVTAVMDPKPEALEQFQAEYFVESTFKEFQPFIESGLDVVFIASPLPFHAEQSIQALNHHVHVLSEVTAATNIRECMNLYQAAKESKAFYMMAENYLYIRENIAVKNMVEKGVFGEVYYAEGEYLHNIAELHHEEDGTPTWRKKFMGGKRGLTYGTHSLGPVLEWINEEVRVVSCFGTGARTNPENKMDDSTTMMCRTVKDALINIRFDVSSKRPHNMAYYTLQGTKGCYESPRSAYDIHRVWLEDYAKNENEWLPLTSFYPEFLLAEYTNHPESTQESNHWGADYFMIKDFIGSILGNKEPRVNIKKSLNMTLPGLLSEESIAGGGLPVNVPDIRTW
ncbi:Gfo/Idh/MocA family protein [Alteribacillus sp. HJP-4]|uniref:Gfo/Idh/MocA family protein n=1 Tax=Alteribacillus sp. HJP-4 TaxID=2775394 RepID=UPI0035CD15F4